jgi:hypothetical protein
MQYLTAGCLIHNMQARIHHTSATSPFSCKKFHQICNGIFSMRLRLWSLACLQWYIHCMNIPVCHARNLYDPPLSECKKPDKCTQTIFSEENCAAESSETRDSWVVPGYAPPGFCVQVLCTKLMGAHPPH